MYIVIEGLKGVGKSTLLDALCLRLQQENVRFSLVTPTRPLPRFCLAEFLAKRCRLLMRFDFFRCYLYCHRSNQHAKRTDWNQPLILGDRSILTSLVTRWPVESEHRQALHIQKTKAQEHEIPWPDEVIYLQMPLEPLLLRLKQRQRDYGKHDECVERLSLAFNAYHSLQNRGLYLGVPSTVGWRLVDANQSPEQVLEEVYTLLKERCPQAWISL